jgi:hypothetical protein
MASNHPLLAPYIPTPSDPFDAIKAAHLLNRAGFGGTPDEIEHVRSIGPAAALDELLDFPDASAEEQDVNDVPDLSTIPGVPKTLRALQQQIRTLSVDDQKALRMKFNMANQDVLMAMGAWWMKRMAYGQHPMQEKLTLFWHGHFTTSAKDEHMSSLMWKQNEVLRRYSAGNFGQLAHAISRDPAMLDYLNNTQNRKAHPNENYARELMELFTLGIGNYTENDVKQGARAFTGWSHDDENFLFNPNQHDTGIKTYLGYTGNLNGDDVVDIILHHPACAPFVAGEMYKFFVSEDLDPTLAAALGEDFRDNDYELRTLLRRMFNSKAFYSQDVIGAQIKSPVQLIAGTIHLLGLPMPQERVLVANLTQMGQVPFLPPNVRGWLGGRTWINTSTVFARYNAGVWLTGGQLPGVLRGRLGGKDVNIVPANNGNVEPAEYHATLVADDPATTAEEFVERCLARLVQRPVDDSQKKILVSALGNRPQAMAAQRTLVQLILSMPEYQLC